MLIKFLKTGHVGIFKMGRKFLKMALCLRSAHSWRVHSTVSSDGLFNCAKQDERLYNVTSLKLSFWSKFAAHTGDEYKTQRMNSCWKYVQSAHQDSVIWNGPVETPPSLTQQTLTYNDFSCCMYNFRQAAAHLTCADLSRSIFLPF